MKFEFSAGGVVFKRQHDTMLVLLCQHSQHHGWVFPKGFIGDKNEHESKEETALRETKEETGVTGTILTPLTPITYWYQMEGEKRKKTVYYFLMRFKEGDIKNHDFEMENVEWLPVDKVAERLTFPSDKKVWEEVKKLLKQY